MSAERVVDRFTKYLNGPMGKTVRNNLSDGESFNLQTSEYLLEIKKQGEEMVVRVLQDLSRRYQ